MVILEWINLVNLDIRRTMVNLTNKAFCQPSETDEFVSWDDYSQYMEK